MELISKEEVIYAIVNTPSKPDFDVMPNRTTFRIGSAFRQHEIIDIINNLPTVESRPKGKWIDYSHAIGLRVKCSNCEQIREYRYNYCPNCGADMRGEE